MILSVLLTVVVLALIVRTLQIDQMLGHLEKIAPVYFLLLAAVAALQNLFLLPTKLRLILAMDQVKITYYESLLLRLTGISLKFLLPMKIGELAKVYYLKRTRSYSVSHGISFVLFDKVTALTGLAFLGTVGCLGVAEFRMLAIPVGFIFLLLCASILTPLIGSSLHLLRFLPDRVFAILQGMSHMFHRVGLLPRLKVLLYSIALMGYDMLYYYLAFRAIGIHVPFSVILLRIPLVYLFTALPLSMYGIGFREGLVIVLMQQYGTAEQLFVAGGLVSIFEILLFASIGTISFHSFMHRIAKANGVKRSEQ